MKKQEMENNKIDFKKLFNLNNILNIILSIGAYIILVGSALVLIYMSFIKKLGIHTDWTTIGIFSATTIFLSMFCWSIFYKKQYEKVMSEDIAQNEAKKYSIHTRYYMAIKDWDDAELQIAIDNFNDEYTAKWLRYVEKTTGIPIEGKYVKILDENGKEILDENGKPIIEYVKGIKELSYKGFKHKILMWRIKNHKYPQSGYKTSMELMSLFSFQESNLNKRNLKSDKNYFKVNALVKLITMVLIICTGASLVPELICTNLSETLLRLTLALGSLFAGTFTGALNGVRGARIKLSIVEDTCFDLERWAHKKPVLEPYKMPKNITNKDINNEEVDYNDIFGPKLE